MYEQWCRKVNYSSTWMTPIDPKNAVLNATEFSVFEYNMTNPDHGILIMPCLFLLDGHFARQIVLSRISTSTVPVPSGRITSAENPQVAETQAEEA